MKLRKILFSAAMFLGIAALAIGQEVPALPTDPETRVGKLDNGLTYYIRHNANPAQRAEFYLATNVGALQETPDQDGLAHFLEHMCFNGTKNFPGKGIINYLESIGASFGGNVNASTGTEQTIYLLTNIPLVRPTVVDSCILIMHDYSHFVTCDPAEIDKERGVILEEKRSRNNAGWRVREKTLPYIFGDTKYATTSIIGTEENLKTFKPESLTNFYHTWYRPDMQALIVVGDIDVDYVEAKIREIFADIPVAENPRQKDIILIPDNAEPIVGIVTDPEQTSTDFDIYYKTQPVPEELNNTVVGYIQSLVEDIVGSVMDERFEDICASPDAPFLSGGMGIGGLCETLDAAYASVTCKSPETSLQAFEAMMMEIEKAKRFGFTAAEVDRAKTEILSRAEAAANRASTRRNAEFVMPLISNFFDNTPYMDPATAYEVAQQMLPMITADVLNQTLPELLTDSNRVIVYTGPEKEGVYKPTEAEILAVLDKVANAEIAYEAGEDIPTEFLDADAIKPGKIKKTQAGYLGSTVLTLRNGVKVILYPSDLEDDRITIDFEKKGGMSLISDEDLYSFESNIWNLYVANTGVSSFSSPVVGKMLTGKQLRMSPYINNYTHGVEGSTTVKDLETTLQILYLYITDPRFDENEYNQGIAQLQAVLPNLVEQSQYKLQKELYSTLYLGDRMKLISPEVLEKASLATIEKNYRRLFGDAAGATVYITGDFRTEEMIPLVQKYIGSLPKGKKATDWKYCGDGYVQGKVINDFKAKMEAPMVTVAQVYNMDKPYSLQSDITNEALAYILGMVYTETLREEEGGTYGASAYAVTTPEPYENVAMQVVFQTNVDQADALRALAVKGLENLAAEGPSAEQFDKARKNLEKNLAERKHNLSWWSSALRNNVLYGIENDTEYEAAVKALTPDMIRDAAKALLESGNFVELVMRPEE